MKKIIQSVLLFVLVFTLDIELSAQDNSFLYPSLNGDSVIYQGNYPTSQARMIDIDCDGTEDFILETVLSEQFCHLNYTRLKPVYNQNYMIWDGCKQAISPEAPNDCTVIPDCPLFWDKEIVDYDDNYTNNFDIERCFYLGFRKRVIDNNSESHYCYGFMTCRGHYKAVRIVNEYGNPIEQWDSLILRLECIVYCTIPDYPLQFGQTSLDWGVKDNAQSIVAYIQPNPTNGEIAITGKDLKKAEVFNSLGQQVVSAQCQGERLTFDLGNLPAGLYFVSVTDTNGRRCVKKVVKQ